MQYSLSRYAPPQLFLLFAFLVCFGTGCDTLNLSKESDIVTGHWTSNVVPVSGECCHLDLMLLSENGQITGSGIVETPGAQAGLSQEFMIEVSGQIVGERISLSLTSENNPGKIEGVMIKNYSSTFELVLRVNFEGLGFKGRDIVLFPSR